MGHLLAIVVPLACGAAVSPTILALQRLDGFFTAHRRGIGATICFAFAVLLAATGLHAVL